MDAIADNHRSLAKLFPSDRLRLADAASTVKTATFYDPAQRRWIAHRIYCLEHGQVRTVQAWADGHYSPTEWLTSETESDAAFARWAAAPHERIGPTDVAII